MLSANRLQVSLLATLTVLMSACTAQVPNDAPPAQADDRRPVQEKKGDLVRQRDLLTFRNHFRQLGLAYQTFLVSEGKAPAKTSDLAGQLQGAKKLIEMLEKGDIVF